MREPKQIRGILDYISLKPGEEFEWEPISESYVPGMGLGASKDAMRWAYKGFMLEGAELAQKAAKKLEPQILELNVGGAPKKKALRTDDGRRAFFLWFILRVYPEDDRCGLTNRRAIQLAAQAHVPGKKKALWTKGQLSTVEQSVSRGKLLWQIDKCWNSEKCKKFYDENMS